MSRTLAFALLAVAGCAGTDQDRTTTETEQKVDTTHVTVHLWHSGTDTAQELFWPDPTAHSVHVFITPGDGGGALTNYQPTYYAWMIQNGSVFKVWRVASGDMQAFRGTMRTHFDAIENTSTPLDLKLDSISGAGGGAGPTGPHIGPGGDGDTYFPSGYVQQALDSAYDTHVAASDFFHYPSAH